MNKPRVIYIIGDNRSGSTLLDYLLSSHPDAVSLGEVHHLHGHYYKEGTGKSRGWKCSCGENVQECEFWSKILNNVSFNKNFKTKIEKQQSDFLKKMNDFLSVERALEDETIKESGKRMAGNRWKIYNAVAEETKKNIIIDSSKNADEAYFLNKHKQGNIRFILLNRDIHEVALSKNKRVKGMTDDIKSFYNLKEQSLYKTILFSFKVYRENHLILKTIQKSTKKHITKTISYVKLTSDPQKTINEICNFLNISEFRVPKKTNIYETPSHVLGGSPSRYESQPIQPDTRWKDYYKRRKIALILSKLLQRM